MLVFGLFVGDINKLAQGTNWLVVGFARLVAIYGIKKVYAPMESG